MSYPENEIPVYVGAIRKKYQEEQQLWNCESHLLEGVIFPFYTFIHNGFRMFWGRGRGGQKGRLQRGEVLGT